MIFKDDNIQNDVVRKKRSVLTRPDNVTRDSITCIYQITEQIENIIDKPVVLKDSIRSVCIGNWLFFFGWDPLFK